MLSSSAAAILCSTALAASLAVSGDGPGLPNRSASHGNSVISYSHGQFSDFEPVAATFVVDSEGNALGIYLSEDADFCSHLENGQSKGSTRTLAFATRSGLAGTYAIDVLRGSWGAGVEFAMASLNLWDENCKDRGDDRNDGQPGVFPVGMGVANTGWLRLNDAADGATLSGEFSLSVGSEGFLPTWMQGRFKASRCNLPTAAVDKLSCL